jgi:hypothetical protein
MAINSRKLRWTVDVTHIGEMRNVSRILVVKSERKR